MTEVTFLPPRVVALMHSCTLMKPLCLCFSVFRCIILFAQCIICARYLILDVIHMPLFQCIQVCCFTCKGWHHSWRCCGQALCWATCTEISLGSPPLWLCPCLCLDYIMPLFQFIQVCTRIGGTIPGSSMVWLCVGL